MSIIAELRRSPIDAVTRHGIAGIAEHHSLGTQLMRLGSANMIASTADSHRLLVNLAVAVEVASYDGVGNKLRVSALPPGVGDSRVRYLPYQDNKCWYVKLDDAADVFVTAELTGCDIYVYGDRSNPWVCHVNRNDMGNRPVAEGCRAKRTMASNAMIREAAGGPPPVPVGAFTRQDYSGTGYQGAFVLGHKKNGDWYFFSFLKLTSGYAIDVINP
jgi:hypothetical protein